MRTIVSSSLLCAAVLGLAAPLGASSFPAADTIEEGQTWPASQLFRSEQAFAGELLAAHNRERDRIGVPPLLWNDALAGQARQWAENLARRHAFEHSRNTHGIGENLWMGTQGAYTPTEMIGGFVDEGRMFRPGRFPNVSRTGNWVDVGHYTQMVWADTRAVGCALARGGGDEFLVCRYWPAGNVMGERVP
jgi:Cysteine-rich secretory protein family